MVGPPKWSPSQKHFLSMYRKGVRAIRTKPEERQPEFYLFLRQQFKDPFHNGVKLSKRDFAMIDWVGRSISRTLENYFYNAGVKKVSMGQTVSPEELGSARMLRSGQRVKGAGREEKPRSSRR